MHLSDLIFPLVLYFRKKKFNVPLSNIITCNEQLRTQIDHQIGEILPMDFYGAVDDWFSYNFVSLSLHSSVNEIIDNNLFWKIKALNMKNLNSMHILTRQGAEVF